jgi:hypothetical protein
MQDAFASWIRHHPDDGRHILCNGYDWSYFTVEDVPFFVRGLSAGALGLNLVLSDRSEELLDPPSLRVGARDALYCKVKGGQFNARFMPTAQTALLPFLFEGPSGEPLLEVGDRFYHLMGPA